MKAMLVAPDFTHPLPLPRVLAMSPMPVRCTRWTPTRYIQTSASRAEPAVVRRRHLHVLSATTPRTPPLFNQLPCILEVRSVVEGLSRHQSSSLLMSPRHNFSNHQIADLSLTSWQQSFSFPLLNSSVFHHTFFQSYVKCKN